MAVYHAKVRLYLTADDHVVEEGDPRAHSLLVRAGGTLPFQTAAKYGLVNAEEGGKALDGPPADTALRQAPEDKAVRRRSTKG